MKLHRNATPTAILRALADGPVDPNILRDLAHIAAGKRQTARVALLRLQEAGMVVVEARLTDKGRLALEGLR